MLQPASTGHTPADHGTSQLLHVWLQCLPHHYTTTPLLFRLLAATPKTTTNLPERGPGGFVPDIEIWHIDNPSMFVTMNVQKNLQVAVSRLFIAHLLHFIEANRLNDDVDSLKRSPEPYCAAAQSLYAVKLHFELLSYHLGLSYLLLIPCPY